MIVAAGKLALQNPFNFGEYFSVFLSPKIPHLR